MAEIASSEYNHTDTQQNDQLDEHSEIVSLKRKITYLTRTLM